jgi:hypothetical protein
VAAHWQTCRFAPYIKYTMQEPPPSLITSVYELLAGYMGSKFYNTVYSMAQSSVQRGQAPSLTAAYGLFITEFEKGIRRPQMFESEVKQIHEFMRGKVPAFNLAFTLFQTKILACFVPPQYLKTMTEQDKDSVFNNIVMTLYSESVRHARASIKAIIDDRANALLNCRHFQDHLISVMQRERATLYRKLIELENKPAGTAEIERRNNIILAMTKQLAAAEQEMNRLKTQLANHADLMRAVDGGSAELSGELAAAKTELAVAKNDLTTARTELANAKDELATMKAEMAAAKAEMAAMKAEMATVKAELAIVKADLLRANSATVQLRAENDKLRDDLSHAAIPVDLAPSFALFPEPKKTLLETSESDSGDDFGPEDLVRQRGW